MKLSYAKVAEYKKSRTKLVSNWIKDQLGLKTDSLVEICCD